jgi:hypothetical protein
MTKWTIPGDLVARARAAKADDRLSDGALYGHLADRIEALEAAIIAALRAPDEATSREILRKARDGE